MPRKATPADIAAHYTQSYRESSSRNLSLDVYFLDEMQRNIQRVMKDRAEKGGPSEALNKLNTGLKGFMETAKQAAEQMGKASPEEMLQLQEKAISHVKNIQDCIDNLSPEEAADEDLASNRERWKTTEINRGGDVLKASGRTQSASKWIEEFQKRVPSRGPVGAEQVALMFAARQLANAQLGKRANIDKTQLSELQLKSQAELLSQSPEFKKYMAENQPISVKLLKSGHGGKLEQTFQNFLAAEGKADLDFDVRNRYKKAVQAAPKKEGWVDVDRAQVVNDYYNSREVKVQKRPDYKNFRDFFNKNIENADGTVSRIAQAAKMAAADDLARKNPDAPFDRKALNRRAGQFLKSPSFRVVTAMNGNIDLICQGKASVFSDEVSALEESCSAMIDSNDKLKAEGVTYLSMERLRERAEYNTDLKPVVESMDKLSEGKISSKDIINTLDAIMTYQEKHAGDRLGSKGRDLNDTVSLMYELTKGRYVGGIVNTQMDKINKARGYDETHSNFLTEELIGREGRQEEKRIREDLGIDKKADQSSVDGLEDDPLNTAMDMGKGHGPVA